MIPGAFDLIATGGFAAAIVFAIAAIARRERGATAPGLYLGAAAVLMVIVSANHAGQQFSIGPQDLYEDYAQLLFLPMVVYMMYSMYATSQAARVERERRIVARLDGRLADSLTELGEHRLGVLQALTAAVDARDHYTALHSMHVADYACAIGYRLGMRDQVLLFEQAGLLHDVGKIGVPDQLLLKPAGLTDDEFEVIKKHVVGSAGIIESVSFLSDVVPMVRHHHERWDGSGYPDGLAGDDIPRAARVIAVADSFDAMTTDRPYRAAMSVGEARTCLLRGRGAQWDPEAVDVLVELLDTGVIDVGAEVR
ncbi:MAG: HD-GYP domain-containing protein [Actinobacteria bacterium]|nr:MAG: HD-GYP domain-containing protein [Actinomycetota bacterium]